MNEPSSDVDLQDLGTLLDELLRMKLREGLTSPVFAKAIGMSQKTTDAIIHTLLDPDFPQKRRRYFRRLDKIHELARLYSHLDTQAFLAWARDEVQRRRDFVAHEGVLDALRHKLEALGASEHNDTQNESDEDDGDAEEPPEPEDEDQ